MKIPYKEGCALKKENLTIQERLAKVRFFKVSPDLSSLTENEKKALMYCVKASRTMNPLYIKQAAHNGLEMYHALKKQSDKEGVDLFKYFNLMGSPWDQYDHDNPFVPNIGTKPKFGSFYPQDLTEKEWNEWLRTHPSDRESFESNYTVIKRKGKKLIAVPYSEEYEDILTDAKYYLMKAASYLQDGNLKNFLLLRANAFSSNDYFESDMAWVDTDGYPFEVTIGPYEVYFDDLFGLKASFEAFVALPDKDSTDAMKKFLPLLPDFDMMLSKEFSFQPKGSASPLEVVSDVVRGGEAGFGYTFVAYNLPNDRRVHDLKGSKKVFSRTMMEAKFFTTAVPIAERIMPYEALDNFTFQNRLIFVLGHELAHGLGPSKVVINGKEVPFSVPMKDLHSSIEEGKADVLGTRLLYYLNTHGYIDEATMAGTITSNINSFFQRWKNGFTEAHAKSNLIEYNWLKAHKALRFDNTTKRYEIDIERSIGAMCSLSTRLLELQMSGNYDHVQAFSKKWGEIASELPSIIKTLEDIPNAIFPIYEID